MKICGIGLATLVFALSVGCCQADYQDVLLDPIKARYDFKLWGGQTVQTYPRILPQWNLPALDLQTNDFQILVFRTASQDVCKKTHRYRSSELLRVVQTNGHEIVRVSSRVCEDALRAQESILERFAMTSCPIPYARYSKGIGDHCFRLVTSGKGAETLVFSRNNVQVTISLRLPLFSAESIARQIDADILKCSLEPPSSEEGR